MKQKQTEKQKTFADYKSDARNWITLATGEYYPEILKDTCELYKPVLVLFGRLLKASESSTRLFCQIAEQSDGWMRIQLSRVFRKYVSPETPVEMLKHKTKAKLICEQFGKGFRPVQKVQAAFMSRPLPDEALCAVLWEYKDRGKKGYDLTERFFSMFRKTFPDFPIKGPERAGRDVRLGDVLKDYPKPDEPVDFVIYDKKGNKPLVIGLAHYDSDRGGTQENRGPRAAQTVADEVLRYAKEHRIRLKFIFINDGPGLMASKKMWNDHARLEHGRHGRVLVLTLRMVPERITREWLLS